VIKELEASREMINKDFTEYRIRMQEVTKNYEREVIFFESSLEYIE